MGDDQDVVDLAAVRRERAFAAEAAENGFSVEVQREVVERLTGASREEYEPLRVRRLTVVDQDPAGT